MTTPLTELEEVYLKTGQFSSLYMAVNSPTKFFKGFAISNVFHNSIFLRLCGEKKSTGA